MNYKQGDRVRVAATQNPYARSHVGQAGTVVGFMGELIVLDLDDGTKEYWAWPYNLSSLASNTRSNA